MRGKTGLLKSGPRPTDKTKHLHIILTHENTQGEILLVSVTSWKENQQNDESCILEKGDHPFIRHKSYIFYRKASIVKAITLKAAEKELIFIKKADCSEALIKRIEAGLLKSPYAPQKCKTCLNNALKG